MKIDRHGWLRSRGCFLHSLEHAADLLCGDSIKGHEPLISVRNSAEDDPSSGCVSHRGKDAGEIVDVEDA